MIDKVEYIYNYCKMSSKSEYLGIPSSETEWLKYKGKCIIFAGKEKVIDENEYDEKWIWNMETEEETKTRLTEGLQSIGVKCESIMFKWSDIKEGQRSCECICYYNKPYQVYLSDFFIKGLSTFDFDAENTNSELEFTFSERL